MTDGMQISIIMLCTYLTVGAILAQRRVTQVAWDAAEMGPIAAAAKWTITWPFWIGRDH